METQRKIPLRHSLWILWPLLLSMGWIGFFVIGARARKKSWIWFGVLYLFLWIASFVAIAALPMDSIWLDISVGVLLFQWIFQLVHLCLCRRTYLTRLGFLQPAAPIELPPSVPNTCVVCGATLPAQVAFCPECGVPVRPAQDSLNAAAFTNAPKPRRKRGWLILVIALSLAAFGLGAWLILGTYDNRYHAFNWRPFHTQECARFFNADGEIISLPEDPDIDYIHTLQSGWFNGDSERLYLENVREDTTFLYDCAGGTPVLIADNAYQYAAAAVGDTLYYYADWDMESGKATLLQYNGRGAPTVLLTDCFASAGFALSPDGNTLLFTRGGFENGKQQLTLCLRSSNGAVTELQENCVPVAVSDGGKYRYYAEAEYYYGDGGDYCWPEKMTAYIESDAGQIQLAAVEDMYSGITFSFNKDLSMAIVSCKPTGTVICRDGIVETTVTNANINASNWGWLNGDVRYGRDLSCSECQTFFFGEENFDNALLSGQFDIVDAIEASLQGTELSTITCLLTPQGTVSVLPETYSLREDGSLMAYTDLGRLITTTDPVAYTDEVIVWKVDEAGNRSEIAQALDCAVSSGGAWLYYRTQELNLHRVHRNGTNDTIIGRGVIRYLAVPGTDGCLFLQEDGAVFATGVRGEAEFLVTVEAERAELIKNGGVIEIYDHYDDPAHEYNYLTRAVYRFDAGDLTTIWPVAAGK